MPVLPNGCPFDWNKEGYEDGSDDGGPFVNIQAVVAWDVRFRFVNGIRSAPRVVSSPAGAVVSSVLWATPWQYPDSTNLYCFECRMVRGVGTPRENGKGGFDYVDHNGGPGKAIYACTFRVPPYDIQGTDSFNAINHSAMPNMSMRKRTGLESDSIPGFTMHWKDPADWATGTAGEVDRELPLETTVTELIYTRHGLPYMPGGPLDDYVGCVNADVFEGYPIGQVKYLGITTDRQVDSGSGDAVQEIEVTFLRRTRDWNTEWSPIAGRGWRLVWSDPTAQIYRYPYVDFNQVFANV